MNQEIMDSESDKFTQLLKSKYYGLVYLGLANAAYTSDWKRDKDTITVDLQVAIESTDYMPLLPEEKYPGQTDAPTMPGFWSLDWGPAITGEWSNLAYVASYRTGENGTGDPVFFVVGIRGTDSSSGMKGVIDQVAQDLRSFSVRPWSDYLNDGVEIPDGLNHKKIGPPPTVGTDSADILGNVATGTLEGFDKIAQQCGPLQRKTPTHEKGASVELVVALEGLLKEKNVPIVVTGHSLGGCQTQVMTSYLAWQFPDTAVIGHPFAPSTAGDEEFAKQAAFSAGCFWWCTLDFIPCGYGPVSDYAPIIDDSKTDEDFYKFNLAISWALENQWTESVWPGTDPAERGPSLPLKDALAAARDIGGAGIERLNFRRPTLAGMDNVMLVGELPSFDVMRDFLIAKGIDPTDEDLKKPLNQLEWQHFPPNYKLMLWERCRSDLVYFNYQTYMNLYS